MAFRRLSFASSAATDLDENDDESEREERRSQSSSSIKSNSTFSVISHLSPVEIGDQIAQCLKLNAENKINDKNAFQLKMIEFMAYLLKKHDPKLSNLQMASACLDASGKIYGYRVDKVHGDLMKIIGGARGEKRPHENDDNLNGQDVNSNLVTNQPKKKRKRKDNFLHPPEMLRGSIESYNPLAMICQNLDIQTSDRLSQAHLPKHANQGISLNLYNDVLLDRIPIERYDYSYFLVPRIADFSCGQLCPAYNAFKFLGWCVDDEPMDTSELPANDSERGEYHFNIDDPIENDDKRNSMMDYRDQDEKFDQNDDQDQQPLNDFQEIIANDPNPDATYEYSYVNENVSIHLVRPSYWRVHIKRDVRYNGVTGSPRKVRRKKDIKLDPTRECKEEAESRFVIPKKPTRLSKNTYTNWLDNLTLPNCIEFQNNRFCSYFTSDTKVRELDQHGKVEHKREEREEIIDNVDLHVNDDLENIDDQFTFPDSEPPSQAPHEQSFLGDNLVPLPKLTDKVFIPYSQRAKKIDMRQLKKSICKVFQNENIKELSQLYWKLPDVLSKKNAQSLSPAVAFTSLLHVSHEKALVLQSHQNCSDVTITNFKVNQQ